MIKTQGVSGFWDFYQYDRPFSAWTYIVLTPILGTSPPAWNVFVLGLRWLSAVFLWLSLKAIWQKKPEQVFWVAILFAVNPLFYQQQVAVAYSQHWISSLFYFASLYLMLKAQESERHMYLFVIASLALSLVQLFTMEYFVGLELLRPALLWFYHRERDPRSAPKDTLRRVGRTSSIYFAGLLIFLVWRLFILDLPGGETNDPVLFSQFVQSPLETLIGLIERVLQDVYYLLASWIVSVNPLSVDLNRPFSLITLSIIGFAMAAFGFGLSRYQKPDGEQSDFRGGINFMVLGFLAIILAMLPVWMIGRQVTLGGDRFSFAALFGVSVVLVGALEWFSSRRAAKITAIVMMLGLSIHTNLYVAKAYQDSWERQRSFYWQLFWRAPLIEPGTAFISDGEIFSFVGLYSTAMGISLLYPPVDPPQNIPYWFFNYHEGIAKITDKLQTGTILDYTLRNLSFKTDSGNSLLLNFPEGSEECLRVFSVGDEFVKEIPPYFRGILQISSLKRIQRVPAPGWSPSRTIFGVEPDHT